MKNLELIKELQAFVLEGKPMPNRDEVLVFLETEHRALNAKNNYCVAYSSLCEAKRNLMREFGFFFGAIHKNTSWGYMSFVNQASLDVRIGVHLSNPTVIKYSNQDFETHDFAEFVNRLRQIIQSK
jgi:hypothetical protein